MRRGPFALDVDRRQRDAAFRARRGPNGRPLCVACETEVEGRRRSWCSDACVNRYLAESNQGSWRAAVWKASDKRCAECRCDFGKMKRVHVRALITRDQMEKPKDRDGYCRRSAFMRWLSGLFGVDYRGHYWEADHILGIADGGEHTVENGRILCVRCHKAETAREAGQRARDRRQARTGQKELFV